MHTQWHPHTNWCGHPNTHRHTVRDNSHSTHTHTYAVTHRTVCIQRQGCLSLFQCPPGQVGIFMWAALQKKTPRPENSLELQISRLQKAPLPISGSSLQPAGWMFLLFPKIIFYPCTLCVARCLAKSAYWSCISLHCTALITCPSSTFCGLEVDGVLENKFSNCFRKCCSIIWT